MMEGIDRLAENLEALERLSSLPPKAQERALAYLDRLLEQQNESDEAETV